jgi:hypothetical protein
MNSKEKHLKSQDGRQFCLFHPNGTIIPNSFIRSATIIMTVPKIPKKTMM